MVHDGDFQKRYRMNEDEYQHHILRFASCSFSNFLNDMSNGSFKLIDSETGSQTTHHEIMLAALDCANSLTSLGAELGKGVGIFFSTKCPATCIVFLAICQSGAHAVMFNPESTSSELVKLHSLNLGLVCSFVSVATISKARCMSEAQNVPMTLIVVDDDACDSADSITLSSMLQRSCGRSFLSCGAHSVLCMIFSSGSTGTPKAVQLTHDNFVASLLALGKLEQNTRVLHAPCHHIAGLYGLLIGILSGSTIVQIKKFCLADYIRLLKLYRAKVASFQVSMIPQLMHVSLDVLVHGLDLEAVLFVAAPLLPEQAVAVKRRFAVDEIQNGYGLTETCGVGARGGSKDGCTVGRLNQSLRFKLFACAADGSELHLRGRSIMLGYLNDVHATADAIDTDGFLHTGDLVRMNQQDELFIIGRLKTMIKAFGLQVSPNELENELLLLPHVLDAAVVGTSDEIGGERPIAFVVRSAEALQMPESTTEHDILTLVNAKLAVHKHIKAVHFISEIPLTSTRKIAYAQLRDTLVSHGVTLRPTVEGDGVMTRTQVEMATRRAFVTVLNTNVDTISAGVTFFDLGGNSLLAVALAQQLSAALGRTIPVTSIFEHPSLEQLVASLCSFHHEGENSNDGQTMRCLMLHGYAANGALMTKQLRLAGWVDGLPEVEFVCTDAFHKCPAMPQLYASLVVAGLYGADSYYCYGFELKTEAEKAVHDSIVHAEDALAAYVFESIGGICDGSLAAAVVAAHNPHLKLYINFCGRPWPTMLSGLTTLPKGTRIHVPSVHLLGDEDELFSRAELAFMSTLFVAPVTIQHPLGHIVPHFTRNISKYVRVAFDITTTSSGRESADMATPRSPVELTVRNIFNAVLNLSADAIGMETSFFELGGTSLLAVALARRLAEALSRAVSVADVLHRPTVAGLASDRECGTLCLPPLLRTVDAEELLACPHPVSWNQSQLLTVHLVDGATAAYNIPTAFWLLGLLTINALRGALAFMAERHAVLRTTYEVKADGDFAQRARAELASDALLRKLAASDYAAAEAVIASDASTGFDLFVDGVLRCVLARVDDDRHMLLMNIHHVAFDGSSIPVLLGELGALYGVLNGGGGVLHAALSALPVQYVDYSLWQRGALTEVLEVYRHYWRAHLREGALSVLELPLDYARPATQTFNGNSTSVAIAADVAKGLNELARSHGATPFQQVLALWALLLCRHAGQEEVVVGSPYHGRDAAGTEKLIGYFVNMLAMRIEVARGGSVAAMVRGVRDAAAGGMRHAAMPFQQIVHELLPKRVHDASRNAVFQATIGWGEIEGASSNSDSNASNIFGDALQVYPACLGKYRFSKFDITWHGHVNTDGDIDGGIRYSTNLFERRRMSRLAERLTALAVAFGDAPANADTWAITIMPSSESELVQWRFNDTAKSSSSSCCIHDLVAMQALRKNAAKAVEWDHNALTYNEMSCCAIQVSSWLREHMVTPDSIVSLQLYRSLELVVGILGVLFSGGAYLPLDPTWPIERRHFMVQDADCKQLVAQTTHCESFAEWFAGARFPLDDVQSMVTSAHASSADSLAPYHLAYLIFTSGSTGKPKGTMVPHAGVVNLLHHAHHRYPLDHDWVFGISQNYVFDMSVFVLFACLATVGGHCVLLEGPSSLLELDDERITHLKDVPSVVASAQIPASARHIHIGGEALTQTVLSNVPLSAVLTNDYGPTELSVNVAAKCIDRAQLPQRHRAIGRPFPNVICHVVDQKVSLSAAPQCQPIGVFGELWVGGVQVTRGYLNCPVLTSEKFVLHPWHFADVSGRGILYRTGDRMCWYADGELEFGGRVDFQVKLRGLRIELGEVEHALRAQPGIAEVVVLLSKELDALVAYVSPASALGLSVVGAFTESARFDHVPILDGAHAHLPAYMLPSLVVGVSEWPRTSTAKIDRKQLPPPAARADNLVPPRNAQEAQIRDVFAAVLALDADTISVEKSFFELGGNSLRALLLVRRLSQVLECEVKVGDVLQCPTVNSLLHVVQGEDSALSLPPLLHSIDVERLLALAHPVSWNQSQLLTVHLVDGATAAYNRPFMFRLHGELSVAAFRGALVTVVQRHAVLRSTYAVDTSGTFSQLAHEAPEGDALARLVSAPNDAAGEALVAADASEGFDLFGTDGVLRCILVRVDLEPRLLLLVVHHVAFDGVSGDVLWGEMAHMYTALSRCSSPVNAVLSDLALQYVDYAIWQRGALTEVLAVYHDFWREHLREGALPVLELPLDYARPATRTFSGDSVSVSISPEIAKRLEELARSHGATLFQQVLALWALLLCRLAGQGEVVVGSPYHGRDAAGTEKLIGYFVNILALRIEVARGGSVASSVRGARDAAAGGMRHAAMPFQQIVQELLLKRAHDASRNAVFQAMLAWGAEADEGSKSLGFNLGNVLNVRPATRGAKVEVALVSRTTASGSIVGHLNHNVDLYAQTTCERFAARLNILAAVLVGRLPATKVWVLPLVPPDEANQILWRFNDTAASIPMDVCVHHMVLAQVQLTPSDVALEWRGDMITYAELRGSGDKAAAWLCARGTTADAVVALQLHRSLEQAVCVLGVILSSAAYLPLDPKWPTERCVFMVEDAVCAQLLTQVEHAGAIRPLYNGAIMTVDNILREDITGMDSKAAIGNGTRSSCGASMRSRPHHVTHVYYTSGSTGRPKGVLVPHAGVVNFLCALPPFYAGVADTWRLGLTTSYVFDPFVRKLFLCWAILGGVCLLMDRKDLFEGLLITEPNHLADVPSVISQVRIPTSVKMVDMGGEAITSTAIDVVPQHIRMTNMYGPTEVSVVATVKVMQRQQLPLRLLSIGQPLVNVVCYIVDADSAEAARQPIGVWGELWLGGVQVARAYLHRPEKTAEVFVVNPCPDTDPLGRDVAYCTGDKVRWYADGEIEYGGRIDFQVKLRGQRVELGEVEHILRAQPHVVEAVVLLVEELDALVAYLSPAAVTGEVQLRTDGFTDPLRLDGVISLESVYNALPGYMVPSLVVGVDKWPRTSSGKIDRKQLPTPDARATVTLVIAPRSAHEEAARRAFAIVLNLAAEALSVEASFFELGGNSLRAVALARRLTEALGREVSVADVLQRPTVAQLVDNHADTLLVATSPLERATGALHWITLPSPAEEGASLSNALVCIHDFTGQLLAFRDFTRLANRPSLGLRCTLQIVEGCTTTRQLATRYVRELQDALPPGRTACLVGYSAGCQIAYRIALTLEVAGVLVQLALLDGRLPALDDGSTVGGAGQIMAVLRRGAGSQFASAAPASASSLAVQALLRLGAVLGDNGCTLADMVLRLADEAAADLGGTFGGATVYLTTRRNALVSLIKDTRIIDGGHFDFMLDHAADVARITDGFFAVYE